MNLAGGWQETSASVAGPCQGTVLSGKNAPPFVFFGNISSQIPSFFDNGFVICNLQKIFACSGKGGMYPHAIADLTTKLRAIQKCS